MSSGSATMKHHHGHHFENAEHEFQSSKFGLWLFLTTEILMFGGLFVAYAIFHNLYPEIFEAGAKTLNWKLGALNTVVLLLSSYTMAMGIFYAQKSENKKSGHMLLATLALGLVFMAIKYFEWSGKFHHGIFPGALFTAGDVSGHANQALYFSLYFMMTGLHASHVLVGMGLIFWTYLRTRKNEFSLEYHTPVECVGLFWHLVDLIWIYLFPLLYLVG